jgi:Zn-dependent alcohol dehydrogenase
MSTALEGRPLQHSAAARHARAALVRAPMTPFSIEDIEVAAPQDGEILVRLHGTGVCHTDLVARDGFPVPLPIVLGHEGAGVVEAVGAGVTHLEVGDHVVMSFNSCGACGSCAKHEPAYCQHFFPLNFGGQRLEDGSTGLSQGDAQVYGRFFDQSSFASLALTRARNVVKIDRSLPLAVMGPLGCGIQTGAGAVMNSLKLQAGEAIAIFGGGAVGLSAVMAAHALGASHIIVVEPNATRRALATELGATHTIDPKAEADVAAAVKAAGPGGVQRALDTTGIPAVISSALDTLLNNGLLGLLGVSPLDAVLPVNIMSLVMRGAGIKAILEGDSDPQVFIPQLIALYQAGRFPFDKLIKTFPFEQINEAAKASEDGLVVKPVIVF